MKNGKYSINELLEPVNKCLALKSVQEFIYNIFYNPKKKKHEHCLKLAQQSQQ